MSNTLDKAFFNQVREAARLSRQSSKRRLISELLEAQRTISEDAYIILKLESALKEVIDLEESESVQSYGFGTIARNALNILNEARK